MDFDGRDQYNRSHGIPHESVEIYEQLVVQALFPLTAPLSRRRSHTFVSPQTKGSLTYYLLLHLLFVGDLSLSLSLSLSLLPQLLDKRTNDE